MANDQSQLEYEMEKDEQTQAAYNAEMRRARKKFLWGIVFWTACALGAILITTVAVISQTG